MGRVFAQAARSIELSTLTNRANYTRFMAVGKESILADNLFVMAAMNPTGYAIIGGVGFKLLVFVTSLTNCCLLQVAVTASVTQAISCAVIAVEITDNVSYLLPCLLVAVISSGVLFTALSCLFVF